MNLGERIKKRRKEMKYSVDHVAKKLGKNRATVYRYESDEIENMPINVISELSKVLDVSPAYLMGWSNIKDDLSTSQDYLYFDTAVSAGLPDSIEAITENGAGK